MPQIIFHMFLVDQYYVWVDMSSEERDVDDYIFTSTNEQSTPYIEWNDPAEDRSINRCASLTTDTEFKLTATHCSYGRRKYVCESEGN